MIVTLSTTMLLAQDNAERGAKAMKAVVKKYDANGNGKLDDNERAAILKDYDTDGDGQLSRGEKVALVRSVAGKQAPPAAGAAKAAGTTSAKWNTPGLQQANTMGGGKAPIPEEGAFRVFVLMGQSNMHGVARAANLKPPYTQKHERIRIWANGQWEYLVPSQKFGPGISMAHQLAGHWPQDTIGIIKVSAGGTGIRAFEKNWMRERADRTFDGKKGSLYKDLMNAVSEAKKTSKPVFSGFVWKQGGADGTKKDLADEYYETFKQLIADLRTELSSPEMPTIVLTYATDEQLAETTLTGKRQHLKAVLHAQNRAGRDIPHTTTVHHGKLPLVDAVHFNHEGQVTLGKMAADALQDFYESKK
jgi:hypothetical protein